MSKTLKMLGNKLLISIVIIGLCFSTAVLHNMLVKNYEFSSLSKYNIFSKTIHMTQGVDNSSMADLEHKITVRILAQETLISFLQAIPLLNRLDVIDKAVPRLKIYLTSGGGSVIAGFGVMNLMKKYQDKYNAKFTTVADKFCYSMCFAILQQGDTRLATYYTMLGTHPASGGDPRALRLLEYMMAENVMMKSYYFISKGYRAWVELYINDFYHNPDLAIYYGLIDGVEKGE